MLQRIEQQSQYITKLNRLEQTSLQYVWSQTLAVVWDLDAKGGYLEVMHLLNRHVWLSVGKDLIHFFGYSLVRNFGLEGLKDLGIFGG